MIVRLAAIALLALALLAGAGVAAAEAPEPAKACPEDGNPSAGLEVSVVASGGSSLNAARGVNQAFESVGCDAAPLPGP